MADEHEIGLRFTMRIDNTIPDDIIEAIKKLQNLIDARDDLKIKLKVDLNLSTDAIKGLEKLAKQAQETQKKLHKDTKTAINHAEQKQMYEMMDKQIAKLNQQLKKNKGEILDWSANVKAKTGEITGATIKYADSLGRVKTEIYEIDKKYKKIKDSSGKVVLDKYGKPKEELASLDLKKTNTKYFQSIGVEQARNYKLAQAELKKIFYWQEMLMTADANDIENLKKINSHITQHEKSYDKILKSKIAIGKDTSAEAVSNKQLNDLIRERKDLEEKILGIEIKKDIKAKANQAKASAKTTASPIPIERDYDKVLKSKNYDLFEKRLNTIQNELIKNGATISKLFIDTDKDTNLITGAIIEYTDHVGKAVKQVYKLKEVLNDVKDAQGKIVKKELVSMDLVPTKQTYSNDVTKQQRDNYSQIIQQMKTIFDYEKKLLNYSERINHTTGEIIPLDKQEIAHRNFILEKLIKHNTILEQIQQREIEISETEKASAINAQQLLKIDKLRVQQKEKLEELEIMPSKISTTTSGKTGFGTEVNNLPQNVPISLKANHETLTAYAQAIGGLHAEYTKVIPKVDQFGKKFLEMHIRMKDGTSHWKNYIGNVVESEQKLYKIDRGLTDVANRQLGIIGKLRVAMQVYPVWMAATTIFMQFVYQVREAITFINDLDKSMTNIVMITGKTRDEVQRMTEDYMKLGQSLHDTISNVTKASEEFLRAGHNQEATLSLIKSSTVMSKIAGQDQKETADQLIAMTNAYGISAEKTMQIVDKLTTVDNQSATSTKELGIALERTSASAQMAGVDFDQLVSYIATISSVTRKSASSIGESFKTIFARMQDINQRKDIDEYGEDISNVEKSLRQVGIRLRDTQDSFKPMNQVLDEIAMKWKTLTDVQQADVAKSIAGVRQRENFVVLMEHYNEALGLQTSMANSAGSAMNRYGEYAKSTEAKINDLTNSFQQLYLKLFNSKVINAFIEEMSRCVRVLDNLISTLGGLGTALLFIIPLMGVRFLMTLKAVTVGAGVLETAMFALQMGIGGTSTKILQFVKSPVMLLIAALVSAALAIAYFVNKEKELEKQTQKTTQAQFDFNKAIKEFQNTLDPSKLAEAEEALNQLKESSNYEKNTEQLKKLKKELESLEKSGVHNEATAVAIGKKATEIEKLQEQIKQVTDAEKEYQNQIEVSKAIDYQAVEQKARSIAMKIKENESNKQLIKSYEKVHDKLVKGNQLTEEEAKLNQELIDKYPEYTKVLSDTTDATGKRNVALGVSIDMLNLNQEAEENLAKLQYEAMMVEALAEKTKTEAVIEGTNARITAIGLEIEALQKRTRSYIDLSNSSKRTNELGYLMEETRKNLGLPNPISGDISEKALELANQNVVLAKAKLSLAKWDAILKTGFKDLQSLGSTSTGGGFASVSGDKDSKSKTKEGETPDTSLDAYYDSLIRLTRANALLTEEKMKTILADIEVAKKADDSNTVLKKTIELMSLQKLKTDQLQASTKELQWEFNHQAERSGFNVSNWFDAQGEGTIEYNREYLASSVEVQKSMSETFSILQKLKKAWIENDQSINQLISTQQDLASSLKDIRTEMADKIIDAIKKAYEMQKELAIKALEEEMEIEERRHQRKIDNLDDELKKLQRQHETEDYGKNLSKAQQEALELQKQIDALSIDNSMEAKAKRQELLEQLADKQEEIAEMQNDRDYELREQNIEDQKDAEDELYENTKQRIEDEIEAEEYKYDQLINDEIAFNQMKEDIIAGSVDKIKSKLQEFLDDFKSKNMETVAQIGVSWSQLLQVVNQVEEATGMATSLEKPTVYVRSGQYGITDKKILEAQYGGQINILINDEKASAFIGKDRYETMAKYADFLKQFGIYPDTSVDISGIYETGGLATKTGLAWLDGTKAKPERILTPEQTESFDKLIKILPNIMKYINDFSLKKDISDNMILRNYKILLDKYNKSLENQNQSLNNKIDNLNQSVNNNTINNKTIDKFNEINNNLTKLPEIINNVNIPSIDKINVNSNNSEIIDKFYSENNKYFEDLLKKYIDINDSNNILGNISPLDFSHNNINMKNVGNNINVNNTVNFSVNGNSELTYQQMDKIASYINSKTINGLKKKGLL